MSLITSAIPRRWAFARWFVATTRNHERVSGLAHEFCHAAVDLALNKRPLHALKRPPYQEVASHYQRSAENQQCQDQPGSDRTAGRNRAGEQRYCHQHKQRRHESISTPKFIGRVRYRGRVRPGQKGCYRDGGGREHLAEVGKTAESTQ